MMRTATACMVLGLLLSVGVQAQIAAAPATADLPVIKVETLATPVKTSRIWSLGGPGMAPAWVPNPRGGWNVVVQCMNYTGTTGPGKEIKKIDLPGTKERYLVYTNTQARPEAEWVVLDVQTGKSNIFNLPGFHAWASCQAENGRLFFCIDMMQVVYYDPVDEQVKMLGQVFDCKPFASARADRYCYKMTLGQDGKIYGCTYAGNGKKSGVLQIDPDTLEYKFFPDIGTGERKEPQTFGYYIATDIPWVYVAVGQNDWELMALNVETGEIRCLARCYGEGTRIIVDRPGQVCTAQLIHGPGKVSNVWCVDGKTYPVVPGGAAPAKSATFKHIAWTKTKPMALPAAKPPQIDFERLAIGGTGEAELYWRPVEGQGEWKKAGFAIKNAEGVRLESLIALPDGSLLGNAESYSGFFHYWPATRKLDYHGRASPSQNRLALAEGKVYISGYPNVMLFEYDPAKPWDATQSTAEKDKNVNPHLLTFHAGLTDGHHTRYLVYGGNGRLYLETHRERRSTGMGLGYYEIATGKQFGLPNEHKDLSAEGLVVLPKLGRVIASGSVMGQSATQPAAGVDAKLLIYDMDLKEVERIRPLAEVAVADPGSIWPGPSDNTFLGCVYNPATKKTSLYLYDLAAHKTVKSVELAEGVRVVQRPADNTWWALQGLTLHQLDPVTLQLTPVGRLESGLSFPVWQGQELYGTRGGNLVRAAGLAGTGR